MDDFFFSEYSFIFNHPLVKLDVISNYSLLLTVRGSDPSLKPYMISSHLDVVDASNESWEVPPFEGRVKDGFIWGRGTIDVKNGVMVGRMMLPTIHYFMCTCIISLCARGFFFLFIN